MFFKGRRSNAAPSPAPSSTSLSLIISDLCKFERTASLSSHFSPTISSPDVVSTLFELLCSELTHFLSSNLKSFSYNSLDCYTAVLGLLRTSLNHKALCSSGIPAICAHRCALAADSSDSTISEVTSCIVVRCAGLFPLETFRNLTDFSCYSCSFIDLDKLLPSKNLELIKLSPFKSLFTIFESFCSRVSFSESFLYVPCIIFKVVYLSFSKSMLCLNFDELNFEKSDFIRISIWFFKSIFDNFYLSSFPLESSISNLFSSFTCCLVHVPSLFSLFKENAGFDLFPIMVQRGFELFNQSASVLPTSRDFLKYLTTIASTDRLAIKTSSSFFTSLLMCLGSMALINTTTTESKGTLMNPETIEILSQLYSDCLISIETREIFASLIIKTVQSVLDDHPHNLFIASFSCSRSIDELFLSLTQDLPSSPRSSIMSLLSSVCRCSGGVVDIEGRVKEEDVGVAGLSVLASLASVLVVVREKVENLDSVNILDLIVELYSTINDCVRSFSKNSARQLACSLGECGFLTNSVLISQSFAKRFQNLADESIAIDENLIHAYQIVCRFLSTVAVSSSVLRYIMINSSFCFIDLVAHSNLLVQNSSVIVLKALLFTLSSLDREFIDDSFVPTGFLDHVISLCESSKSTKVKATSSILAILTQSIFSAEESSVCLIRALGCAKVVERLLILFFSKPHLREMVSIALASLFHKFSSFSDSVKHLNFIEFALQEELNLDKWSELYYDFFGSIESSRTCLLQVLKICSSSPKLEEEIHLNLTLNNGCLFASILNVIFNSINSDSNLLLYEDFIDTATSLSLRPSTARLFADCHVCYHAINLLLSLYENSLEISEADVLICCLETLISRIFSVACTPLDLCLITEKLLDANCNISSNLLHFLNLMSFSTPYFVLETGKYQFEESNGDFFNPFLSSSTSPSQSKKIDFGSNGLSFSCFLRFLDLSTSNLELLSILGTTISLEINKSRLVLIFQDASGSRYPFTVSSDTVCVDSELNWKLFCFSIFKQRFSWKVSVYFDQTTTLLSSSIPSNVSKHLFKVFTSTQSFHLTVSDRICVAEPRIYNQVLSPLEFNKLSKFGGSGFESPGAHFIKHFSEGFGVLPSTVGGCSSINQFSHVSSTETHLPHPSFVVNEITNDNTTHCLKFSTSLSSLFYLDGIEFFGYLFSNCSSSDLFDSTIDSLCLLANSCKSFRHALSHKPVNGFHCSNISVILSSMFNSGNSSKFFSDSHLVKLMSLIGLEDDDVFDQSLFDCFLECTHLFAAINPTLITIFFKRLAFSYAKLHKSFSTILSIVSKTLYSEIDSIRNLFDLLLNSSRDDLIGERIRDTVALLNCCVSIPSLSSLNNGENKKNLKYSTSSVHNCSFIIYVLQKLCSQAIQRKEKGASKKLLSFIQPSHILPFLNKNSSNYAVASSLIRVALDFSCVSDDWLRASRDVNLWYCIYSFITTIPVEFASKLILFSTANSFGFNSLKLIWALDPDSDVMLDSFKELLSHHVKTVTFPITSSMGRCVQLSLTLLEGLAKSSPFDRQIAEVCVDLYILFIRQCLSKVSTSNQQLGSLPKRIENSAKYLGDLLLTLDGSTVDHDFEFETLEKFLMEEFDFDAGENENDLTLSLTPDSFGFNQFSEDNIDEEVLRFPAESPCNSDDEDSEHALSPFPLSQHISLSGSLLKLTASMVVLLVLDGDKSRLVGAISQVIPQEKDFVRFSSVVTVYKTFCRHLSQLLIPYLRTLQSFEPPIFGALNSVISIICSRLLGIVKLIDEKSAQDDTQNEASHLAFTVLDWVLDLISKISPAIIFKVLKSGAFNDVFHLLPLLLEWSVGINSAHKRDNVPELLGPLIYNNLHLITFNRDDKLMKIIAKFLLSYSVPSLLSIEPNDEIKSPFSLSWTVKIWHVLNRFFPSLVKTYASKCSGLSSAISSQDYFNGFELLSRETDLEFKSFVLSESFELRSLLLEPALAIKQGILADCTRVFDTITDNCLSVYRQMMKSFRKSESVYESTLFNYLRRHNSEILENRSLVKRLAHSAVRSQFESSATWRFVWSIRNYKTLNNLGVRQSRHLNSSMVRSNLSIDYTILSKFPPLKVNPDQVDSQDEKYQDLVCDSRSFPVSKSEALSTVYKIQAFFSNNSTPLPYSPLSFGSVISSISTLESLICSSEETIESIHHVGLVSNTLDSSPSVLIVTNLSMHLIVQSCINNGLLKSIPSQNILSAGQEIARKLGTLPPTFMNPLEALDLSCICTESNTPDILFRLTQRRIIDRRSIISVFERSSAHEAIGLEIFVSTCGSVIAGGGGRLDSIFLIFGDTKSRDSVMKRVRPSGVSFANEDIVSARDIFSL
ncbi:hypothetical protein P9112_004832 [Eukaryota sp. TZLM1-RC]